MQGSPGLKKRLDAPERRATILSAAKSLFAQKGFHGVTVDEITTALAISPAILYRHFPSKEALYEEVLNGIACQRVDYFEAALQEPSDFASVLRRLTYVYIDVVAKDPDYLRMEMHGALEGSGITQQFFNSRWKQFSDYIETGLRDLIQERRARCDNPQAASLMFQGMIREVLYTKCILGSEHSRDMNLSSMVDQLVSLFLKAICYSAEAVAPIARAT
ncbi:MAG: TetR/AcrR family transcriptional regulator [Gammaproteobacteria bacterium]